MPRQVRTVPTLSGKVRRKRDASGEGSRPSGITSTLQMNNLKVLSGAETPDGVWHPALKACSLLQMTLYRSDSSMARS